MKTINQYIFKGLAAFILGTLLISGCQTSAKRVNGEDKLKEAREDLKEATQDISQVVKDSIQNFKTESQIAIDNNEKKIAAFQKKIAGKGKVARAKYDKKIDALKQRNIELKNKLEALKDNEQNEWQAFKREFNHDMNELEKSLKDLTVDNTD